MMANMFSDAESFNQDIGKWDVSKVTDMSNIFLHAKSFNQDIGTWDVSNVTMMANMFSDAESFNQDIGKWDVSKVTGMSNMFFHAKSFNQDIGKWDVSKVKHMMNMFQGAASFNQDISKWDVSKASFYLAWDKDDMFLDAASFNQDISNWDKKREVKVRKKLEFNSMIRLCFESVPDELGNDLCLVKGALIIMQERNSKWAYGYHIKNQGGGTVGEYHLILKASEDKEMEQISWESAVGDWIEFDDLTSTAADLKGFDEDEAMEMFDELDSLWSSTLHWGSSVDEEVESPYNELFLCYKSKFSNLEESQGSFWYVKDNISDKENFLQYLDIEDVSGDVPGNMSFLQ
jgi:surface protein